MRHAGFIALVMGCGGSSVVDADEDGVAAAQDCNDDDPRIYPGALETKGDGVDSDCDGQDPDHGFFGDWELVGYAATLGGQPVFDDLPYSGQMTIEPDLSAEMVVEFEAYNLQLPAELEGTASPLPGPDAFNLDMTGIFAPGLQDSPAAADLDCESWEDAVICEGALLIIGYSVLATFDFEPMEAR